MGNMRKTVVKVFILFCLLVVGVLVADMIYDRTYNYQEQCTTSGIKSVSNKGLFKINVECR